MTQESLFDLPHDYGKAKREVDSLQKDIAEAKRIVNAALQGYVKQRLKARSKKEAEDAAAMFAELEYYEDLNGIQDAFGYGDISEAERQRLVNLCELRENFDKQSNKYTDRITEMIDKAIRRIGDEYQEQLGAFEDRERQLRKESEACP